MTLGFMILIGGSLFAALDYSINKSKETNNSELTYGEILNDISTSGRISSLKEELGYLKERSYEEPDNWDISSRIDEIKYEIKCLKGTNVW